VLIFSGKDQAKGSSVFDVVMCNSPAMAKIIFEIKKLSYILLYHFHLSLCSVNVLFLGLTLPESDLDKDHSYAALKTRIPSTDMLCITYADITATTTAFSVSYM
jgi:hypothetical protein